MYLILLFIFNIVLTSLYWLYQHNVLLSLLALQMLVNVIFLMNILSKINDSHFCLHIALISFISSSFIIQIGFFTTHYLIFQIINSSTIFISTFMLYSLYHFDKIEN